MDVFVNYSCEYQGETGRVKLTLPDIDTTSIADVKLAIQDAIQAPVCDQRLSYRGQMLTDDNIPLCRLYFREGDCFELHFLVAADIKGMRRELTALKATAFEIVEKLERRLPGIQRIENDSRGLWLLFHPVLCAVENITNDFFHPWKCLKSVAQRHFFVQEGGFESFLEVFKFSRQLYSIKQSQEITREDGLELRKWRLNRALLILQQYCLKLLWAFSEQPQDREFVLSKRVLPLIIDALLLPYPFPVEEYALSFHPLDLMVVRVNEAAIGCFGGLVEQDSSAQELVAKTPQLVDKFLFVIHCACRGCPLGCAQHSLFSSQLAAITMFYCTFNVKSAQSFVDCGAVEKMIQITTNLFANEENYDTPLRYYCCLFLARICSSPLVKLDGDIGDAVDHLVDMFLAKHIPSQISQWEESLSFVWVTMVPLVHLAFASGKKWKNPADQSLLKSTNVESQYAMQSTQSLDSTTTPDASTDGEKSGRPSESLGRSDQLPWPGSLAIQRLGIFSLVHMLSIEDNRQLALSENLLPYLVCLLWHLGSDDKDKLRASLANFKSLSPPPLKIVAKSALAFKNGLDVVYMYSRGQTLH